MDLTKSKELLDTKREVLGDDLVEFFTELWSTEEKIEATQWEPSNLEAIEDAIENGKPAFTVEHPNVSKEAFFAAFNPLIETIRKSSEPFDMVFKAGIENVPERKLDVSDEALEIAFSDQQPLVNEICEQLGIENEHAEPRGFIELAVIAALRPTAIEAARKITVPKETGFDTGICPICGNPATMGVMTDQGALNGEHRNLWCTFCETRWYYPRIKCVRCGSTSQEDLDFFIGEDDRARRIYTCRKCEGSAKIVSEKELNAIADLRVEELAMIPLEASVLAYVAEHPFEDEDPESASKDEDGS